MWVSAIGGNRTNSVSWINMWKHGAQSTSVRSCVPEKPSIGTRLSNDVVQRHKPRELLAHTIRRDNAASSQLVIAEAHSAAFSLEIAVPTICNGSV